MGRGLLIFIAGMFIVVGIMNIGTQQRTLSSEKEMSRDIHYKLAFNNAMSAGEMAALDIMLNHCEYTSCGEYKVEFDEGPAIVDISRQGNIFTLVSQAISNGVIAEVESRYFWESEAFIPDVHGAIGIYSENLNFNVAGNAFEINGNDHLSGGGINPDGIHTNGIAVDKMHNKTYIEGELNNQQENNIKGIDGIPSIGLVGADVEALESAIEYLADHADEYHIGDYTASGAGSLGTKEEPKIIVVESGTLSLSNATGTGILIIRDGGELDVRGNLDYYEGLIFVQGSAKLVRGNVNIYGAMVFGGLDPELEIDIDLRGNVHIQYSSEVIDFLNSSLSSRFSGRLTLLGHYY